MLDLANKSVLVTGAASGIGRASAARFAAAGARVIVTDVTEESGKEARLRSAASTYNSMSRTLMRGATRPTWRDRPQPLAVAHLNAGIRLGAPAIVDVSDAQYSRILGANLSGVFYGIRAVVPLLEAAGGGAIIVTASRAALQALPQDPCYAMTKHAVAGLVRSVADDLGQRGISVNAICPAIVDTGFLEGRRADLESLGLVVMEPEEVAAGVMAILESGETGRCFVQEPGGSRSPTSSLRPDGSLAIIGQRRRGEPVQPGVDFDAEGVERHRQAGVRADDEGHLHQLPLVELLGQASPGLVIDAIAIDELIGRGEQVGFQRRPALGIATAPDGFDLFHGDADALREANVLRPLVGRSRSPGDAQHHQLVVALPHQGAPASSTRCTRGMEP